MHGARPIRLRLRPFRHLPPCEGEHVDLYEYQAKELFAAHGVPAPAGRVARSVDEAVAAAEELGTPVMVKSQVKIGGRGKAGGVKFAATLDDEIGRASCRERV